MTEEEARAAAWRDLVALDEMASADAASVMFYFSSVLMHVLWERAKPGGMIQLYSAFATADER